MWFLRSLLELKLCSFQLWNRHQTTAWSDRLLPKVRGRIPSADAVLEDRGHRVRNGRLRRGAEEVWLTGFREAF